MNDPSVRTQQNAIPTPWTRQSARFLGITQSRRKDETDLAIFPWIIIHGSQAEDARYLGLHLSIVD